MRKFFSWIWWDIIRNLSIVKIDKDYYVRVGYLFHFYSVVNYPRAKDQGDFLLKYVKCEEETIQYLTASDDTEYIRIGGDVWKERMNGFDYEIWNMDRIHELEKMYQNYLLALDNKS